MFVTQPRTSHVDAGETVMMREFSLAVNYVSVRGCDTPKEIQLGWCQAELD